MKKVLFTICLSLLCWGVSLAQTDSYQYAYQDSLRLVLENTKNTEAGAVGVGFATLWSGLGPDQQMTIRDQIRIMRSKGYRLRPHLVNYLGAVVDAINFERTDPARMNNYLTIAGKVVANELPAKANDFFNQARDFFRFHALNYEKALHLNISDDDYRFDYIDPNPLPLPLDTAQIVQAFPDTAQQAPDTITVVPPPPYMQPEVQPVLTGPIIRFTRATFTFSTPYDSAILSRTKGIWSLRDKLFVGEGGHFEWISAGLSGDSVFYELKDYHFASNSAFVKARLGSMVYPGKIHGRVQGEFEFRSTTHSGKSKAVYPRFSSYGSDVSVIGLGNERMKYTGGFGLNGSHMNSSSVGGEQAVLEVMGETDVRFKAKAKIFEFRDSVISAVQASISLYQGNDSIYHPSTAITYDYGKERLLVAKDKSALRRAPFSSSFFGVDFSADRITWDLRSDSLNLYNSGGGNISPFIIESIDFYDPESFAILRGQSFRFNPLGIVVNYATKTGQREFSVYELADKFPVGEVRAAMDFLAQKGMIGYESSTGKVSVREKAYHFMLASRGEADYDNLKIHSVTNKSANASINLDKRYMTVRGVEEFNVSDSLNVIIKPDSSIIKLLKNRDIKFDGTITAGNFEISGKDFTLKYDSFFINLNHIDSIRFYVTEKDGTRRRVNNSMVGADSTAAAAGGLSSGNKTSATLFINRPDNKSGKESIPNYPRLDATAGGVIYFDRPEVLDGAYDRSVFFVVPPFKLDSLSDADPGAINFEGTFVSSGMLPSFKDQLHTMPDKSLGFSHKVPTTGYTLFQGQGKLFGSINMDNSGIRATGKINYLAANVESTDFIFYPDSVVGKGKVGEIMEKQYGSIYFPQVTLPDYKLKWLPKQDKFKIKNLRDPFSLYNSTAALDGNVTVSKAGLFGSGRLTTRGSELNSRELNFSAKEFSARHALFLVKTDNPNKPALSGNDVQVKFNLEKNIATISPEEEGVAAIDFPYAQFKTSIPEARWDLNTQRIVMSKAANVPIENSYFYTTRKELDSLNFNAEKAEYDIKSQQLKVSGIPYITVADARITPENNEVLILENARIGQLKNTTIVMDTLNGYHRLTHGVVDIISRREFSGYATYQYVNAVNDTFNIKMTDFHLEKVNEDAKVRHRRGKPLEVAQQTVGNGAVTEADKIIVAPRIYYKGDMRMYATRPALQLKGFVKLDLKKIKNYNTWLLYEQSGDEKEVYLNFDEALTEDGKKAEAGLYFAPDNTLYINFVSDKRNSEDEAFFVPSGSLFFDKESGEFKIEDREKAAGNKLSGKVFAYNEEKQEVRFEGQVNFFRGLKDFNVTSTALGSGSLETNDIKMNSFVMADMNIPATAYQIMALQLTDIVKALGASDGLGDQSELLYKIADLVGEKAVKEYEQKSQQGYLSLSSLAALNKSIVFSNVNLKYARKFKAFYSEGTLGLSHIGKFDINNAFEGFMEIRKNDDGTPVFHVFFKAAPEAWYYFGYEDNRLMAQSSNPEFNAIVAKKSNAGKAKVGEMVFIPGSDDETLAFINRFRKNYYELEAPYELNAATAANKARDTPKPKEKEKEKEKKKDEKDDGF